MTAVQLLATFTATAAPPDAARRRAAAAFLDTVGVTLAGATEPAARAVQQMVAGSGGEQTQVFGTALRGPAATSALANGTAAHALDYDDMCFVSLAHPSAPLVPAALAAAELAGQSGRAALDAYVVGFEVECLLGRRLQPRHYQRGWHPTSTLGTIGSAAAASRLFGLDAGTTAHALAIAASQASGLKENFGTMIKPLHAGLAAHNGITAALLAQRGLTGSELAIDGPQGFLSAMDGSHADFGGIGSDLGTRWEILETGITVKLYPSCAGTHPALDALLLLRRRDRFSVDDVEAIEVAVDSITPTILIHDRPSTGLEGKFSMPYCAAAAIVHGRVGLDTFEPAALDDPAVRALMPRVTMHVDPRFDGAAPPLTQSRVAIRLRDGCVLELAANGARGYPTQPASDEELTGKFLSCAERALGRDGAARALEAMRSFEEIGDLRDLIRKLAAS